MKSIIWAATILAVTLGIVARVIVYSSSSNSIVNPQASEAGKSTRPSGLYRPSFCELYRWAPEDYFEDPEAIAICLAIQSRNSSKLKSLIRQGYDLNTPGKAGVTVLLWAFFDDNLEAFKILLEAGADPDQKLTDFIRFELRPPLRYGDSVVFTCLRERWHDYFLAAFAHTKDPRQVDALGETLLLVYALPIPPLDERVIDRLAKGGVDFNATSDSGTTAALRALCSYKPRICLALLKAGADPDIADKEGRTVSVQVNNLLAIPSRRERLGEPLMELRNWLDAHAAQAATESSSPEDDAAPGSVSDDPS